MTRVVFDTYAILAWLKREPGYGFVVRLLRDVAAGELWGGVSIVNMGEVLYVLAKEQGIGPAEEAVDYLVQLSWEILPATNDIVWAAARLKASHPISYADAFALACAQEHGADLVTDDPELRAAPHGVTLLWEIE